MAWPGFPTGYDAGWWRINVITPPVFTGTGSLTNGAATVGSFAATYQGQAITPLAGQRVAGTGIPAGATVLASPAPTATAFTMSASSNATNSAVSITVGAEPITVAQAKQWARVEFPDDDTFVLPKLIASARRYMEGPRLKRAILLQSRRLYMMGFPWGGGYYNRAIRSLGPNPWWLPGTQGVITLPYPPLKEILSVKYIDPSGGVLTTIDPAQYRFVTDSTPGQLMPVYGAVWPLSQPTIDAVQIAYSCGYGALESDVPEDVQLAIAMLVSGGYENRDSDTDDDLKCSPAFERAFSGEDFGSYV